MWFTFLRLCAIFKIKEQRCLNNIDEKLYYSLTYYLLRTEYYEYECGMASGQCDVT
jgi:hypothetical protein